MEPWAGLPRSPTGCDRDTRDTTRELKSSLATRVPGVSLLAAPGPAPGTWDVAEPSGSPSVEQSPDGAVSPQEARKGDFKAKGALARGFAGQMLAAVALCRGRAFCFGF